MELRFDKTKNKDVVAFGRATIDLYANEIGPMEDAISFNKYVGGSPANTSVAMARLGLNVGYIGKVSDDPFGRYISKFLQKERIDTSHITIAKKGINSGITIGEILPDTCNCFMYRNNCADLFIDPKEIDESYIASYKVLLVSGTSLSYSPSRESVFLAVEMARRNNTRIIFDIDFRNGTWINANEASTYLTLVAQKSDVVIGTREEFDVMEYLFHFGNKDNRKSAEWLINEGVKMVSIKNGKNGSFIFTKNNIVRGGIYPTKVLKTFGAGDSYSAAFCYGLLHDMSIEESLKYAAAASSITITGHSCSDAMPNLNQVKEYIKTNKYVLDNC